MTTPDQSIDLRHRVAVVRSLRDIRLAHGMTLQDVGDDLHITFGAVHALERHQNPRIGTVQRYARALDHRADMQLWRIPGAAPLPFGIGDGDATIHIRRELAAARERLGLTQAQVGARIGVSNCAVHLFEHETRDPALGTMQRHARGVGGRLVFRIVPAPVVDEVAVEQTHTGKRRFGSLSPAEQVELFRRYRHTATQTTLLNRWGVSHGRMQQIVALADGVAA